MFRDAFPRKELFLKAVQSPVQGFAVISKLIRVKLKMEVHPPLFFDRIALIWPLLFVVPGDRL